MGKKSKRKNKKKHEGVTSSSVRPAAAAATVSTPSETAIAKGQMEDPDITMWQDLFNKELQMLRELPRSTQQKLNPGVPFPFYYFLHSGEIALVLARIKPCSVVGANSWEEFGPAFYEKVLHPWFTKYQKRLTAHGFAHALLPDNAATYITSVSGANFGNSAIFYDNKSPQMTLVDEVFFRRSTEMNLMVTTEELQVCFGFPAKLVDSHGKVTYNFNQPEELFGLPEESLICPATCLEYEGTESDAAAIGCHFYKCQTTLYKQFKISIALDNQHMELWSDAAIVTLWLHAVDGDYERFNRFRRQEIILNRIEDPNRYWSIANQLVAACQAFNR